MMHWDVYHTCGTVRVLRGLGGWMNEVTNFAKVAQGTAWQQRALSVLAMSFQLQGNVARDMMNYELAHTYYQHALRVAKEIDDPELAATAMLRDGYVYFHRGNPVETIRYLKGAIETINYRGLPNLRRQLPGALSEAQAKAHQGKECWCNIELSESAALQIGSMQERTSFLFVAVPATAQKGINAALLKDHKRSLALIDKSLNTYSPTLTRSRTKLVAQKAEAYFGLREIDYCIIYAEEALVMARSPGSDKRIAQIQGLHTQLLQSQWKQERSVARLGALLLDTQG